MATLKRDVPNRIKSSAAFQHGIRFLPVTVLLFIIGIAVTGCGSRIVRVQVSQEDMRLSYRYIQEGTAAYKNKDYYAALIKYLMARDLNPNSEYTHNYIGITYLNLKYYEKAIKTFRHSIELNKKFSSSVNNLGSAFFATGDYKKAEKYFKKAIGMKEDEASFYLNLGTLYFETKKPDKAMKQWRKSLELDPEILTHNNAVSVAISGENIALKDRYYFMARLFAAAGNIPKVIESLENALLNGFSDIEQIQNSSEFDPIRKDERFVKFMESASVWAKPN